MFVPCGPQSARCDHPGALRLLSRPLPRLFSFPGVLTLWPAALARHGEPFSTFSGSAPSLQFPCFRPPALSAGGTRPGTQTVAPGLLRIPRQQPSLPKKGLRGLPAVLRSQPTAKMLQCWRSGPTRRTERSQGGRGKKGLLRDSACVLTCRRSGCSSETCLPAPFFSRNTAFPPPRPSPGPGVECNIL